MSGRAGDARSGIAAGAARIVDPLPQRYLTTTPGIGGRLKERAEDFIVEEIPLYEPSGAGEHLYLRIQKRNVAHSELMSCLRRAFDVTERAIGYAGMKDKRAVTTQTVSIHLPGRDPGDVDLGHDRMNVQWAARHRNKIRRGHLRGNRFSIRVRGVEPVRAPAAAAALRSLQATGAPAYFGAQRFGYRRNNHIVGAAILAGDWARALDELLGTSGAAFPDYQRERREDFDAGRYAAAAAAWTTADRSELIASKTLASGGTPFEAMRAIGRTVLRFWTSSVSSAAFNRALDGRIDDGLIGRLVEGDLAWKHASRAVFAVTAEELAAGTLPPRLAALEISPSGPLWGSGMTRAGGPRGRLEEECLAATGATEEDITTARYAPVGSRRPFRTPIENIDVEGGFDAEGPYVRVAFDLPRGMYATVVMREVLKGGAGMDEEGEGGDGGGD